jgi:tetratricopeptide (TPR) repeat protein
LILIAGLLHGPAAMAGPNDLETLGSDPTTALYSGNVLLNQGKYEKALAVFRPSAESDPAAALGAGLCLWKLNRSAEAAPFLRRAKAAFPDNPSLQRALYAVEQDEIQELREQLLRVEDPAARRDLYRKLAVLHESSWQWEEAARTFLLSLPANPDEGQLIRAAWLHKMARSYRSAADVYLKAARHSSQPQFALQWAAECLILARQFDEAEKVLTTLRARFPGPDVEWLWADLHRARGERAKAAGVLSELVRHYQREIRAKRDIEANRFRLAKANLLGADPETGKRQLDQLAGRWGTPDADLDELRASYYEERQQYLPAIALYRRHPNHVAMQVKLGHALARAHRPAAAQRHFADLMARFPHCPEVIEGWQAYGNYRTWEASYRLTRLDYGDYKDPRDLHTVMVTHDSEKANSTFAFTRTNTHASTGAFDFAENLLGLRLRRRLAETGQAQVHLMVFQNNDWLTDNGWVFGGKYSRVARERFHWSAELDSANFPDLNAIQSSLALIFHHHPHWSSTLGLDASFLQGAEAGRAETRTPAGLRTTVEYHDHNATIALTALFGQRILYVDSEGLFAPLHGFDTYRQGGRLSIRQKAQNLDLFLDLGVHEVTAKYLRQSKEPLWKAAEVDYRLQTISAGASLRFF